MVRGRRYSFEKVLFIGASWYPHCALTPRSHYPLGVLYDAVGKAQRGNSSGPWKILLHFVAPAASSEISSLELTGAAICERLYFHSLKQALQLLYGSIRNFNELSLEKQSILWMSPTKKQWEQFYVVREALIPSAGQMKALPLRVLDARKRLPLTLPIPRQGSVQAIKGDKPASLRELLVDRLAVLTSDDLPHVDVVVQGVTCDLDTEAYEMWRLLCHADLFLYIVIRDREASLES